MIYPLGRERRWILDGKMAAAVKYFGIISPCLGMQIRVRHVLQFLVPELRAQAGRIVDIGCGQGALAFYLAQNCPESEIYGIDKSQKYIDDNQKINKIMRLPNLQFYPADVLKDLPVQNAKWITCLDAIAHVDDPNQLLRMLYQALAPGGKLILHLPRYHQTISREKPADHDRQNQWFDDYLCHLYDEKGIIKGLQEAGFSDCKLYYTFGAREKMAQKASSYLANGSNLIKQIIYILTLPFLFLIAATAPRSFRRGAGMIVIGKKAPLTATNQDQ